MFALSLILTIFTSVMTISYGQLSCASGWQLYGGKCYLITPVFNAGSTSGGWDQCNSYCQNSYRGASMLCVQDVDQNKWLTTKYGANFWIGYTDMPPFGGGKGSKNYGWVTGCSSRYTNWYAASKEPNNSGNNEDCTMIWTAKDGVLSEKWNDAGCGSSIQCGCQYTPVTTVAPSLNPTTAPSSAPTTAPSSAPTTAPSSAPTIAPSSAPTIDPSSAPTIAPSSGPSVVPSNSPTVAPSAAPSISPTTLSTALVPAIQLPTCPIGWTLHCSCEWTDEHDHAYPDSSPVVADSLSWDAIYNDFSLGSAVVGSLVTLIIVVALYACTRSVKDLAHRSEYAPILDRE